MVTQLFLRYTTAAGTVPNAQQSTDTIFKRTSIHATYELPYKLSTAPIGGLRTNQIAQFDYEPGYPNYLHLGTWVSNPLSTNTTSLSGTFSLHLGAKSFYPSANSYPRVYAYLWHDNDTKGTDIIPLITSTIKTSTAGTITDYFVGSTIATVTPSSGDRIVVEIETFNNNSATSDFEQTQVYYESNSTGSNSYSYIEFSQSLNFDPDIRAILTQAAQYYIKRDTIATKAAKFNINFPQTLTESAKYMVKSSHAISIPMKFSIFGESTPFATYPNFWYVSGGSPASTEPSDRVWNLRQNKRVNIEDTIKYTYLGKACEI
jgi:hypothetical protein